MYGLLFFVITVRLERKKGLELIIYCIIFELLLRSSKLTF